MQDQFRHRELRIPGLTEHNELVLVTNLPEVSIVSFLACHRTLPGRGTPTWHVVMPGEQARLFWQSKDALNGTPERPSVASGEVTPCGAEIRHEKRVVDEGSITNQIGDGSQRVPWREQDPCLQLADLENIVVSKQLIPV